MAVLAPCLHCHRRADCAIKADTLKRIRGAGITKATLKCKIPQEDFPPGATVDVKTFRMEEYDYGYAGDGLRKTSVIVRGVVMKWRDRKAVVAIDKAQEIETLAGHKLGIIKVPPDVLTRIGDDVAELCACGFTVDRCVDRDLPSMADRVWNCGES